MQKLTGAKAKLGSLLTGGVTGGAKLVTGTSNYSVAEGDLYVSPGSTAALDIRLPTVLGSGGRLIIVEKSSGQGVVTLYPSGAEPIGSVLGASSSGLVLQPNYPHVLVSSGSTAFGWRRLSASTSV